MTTYIAIISSPAKSIDPSVTEKTFQVIESDDPECVFKYVDTNTARGEINIASQRLASQRIAIIGLGGTGSYILDLIAKTPVKEIHLHDGDKFLQHNAFRAPGAPSAEKLRQRIMKTDYLKELYSNMHRNIISHPKHIDTSNVEELSEMGFVFMCIDKGEAKTFLVDHLEKKGIQFVDCGMGLEKVDDQLIGIVRVTTNAKEKRDHFRSRVSFSEGTYNEYSKNIQIADLNALNAALAVIKWKKLYGFYQDLERENHTLYTINTSQLLNEDSHT